MALPNTSYYLPKGIRDLDLNARISVLLDYVRSEHHDSLISHPSGKWDASSPNYDANNIVEELDGQQYLKYIQSGEDLTSLSRMLTGLYNMKGSIRALQMILNILDIKGEIVTYFQVQRQVALGTDQGAIWEASPDYSALNPCEVIVTLDVDASSGLSTNNETILAELLDVYLWSCTKLAAILVIRYVNDTLPTLNQIAVDKEIDKDNDELLPLDAPRYSTGRKYSTGVKYSLPGTDGAAGIKDTYQVLDD
ncbi:hypothetical protein NVP1031O_157 [Vibrio phage 1.031.O._10N.261.46.F8]|nr:hypothetical protein NVP1031O_157 [Vibrio phage 1.031.O._10N.261.46.F8]